MTQVVGLHPEPGSVQPRQTLAMGSEPQVLCETGVMQCCGHPFPQLPACHWNPSVMRTEPYICCW